MLNPTLLRLVCWLLFATSWLTGLSQPQQIHIPPPIESTSASLSSLNIPPSGGQIVAAVYPFQLTGDQRAQWSNQLQVPLVDQYTSILVQTLQSSGWFIPVAQGNISILLNERPTALVGHNGEQTENGNPAIRDKPTVMLEAGLFSHDTRNVPGEIGGQYFANGESGQFRMDRTTVFLRALSTQSGKILNTVYWTKTLLSQLGSNQTYRYIEVNRLHGNPSGNTKIDPEQFILAETIKEAVRGLIIEGVRDGLWAGGKLSARQSANVITAYEAEKKNLAEAQQLDMQPRREANRQNPSMIPSLVSVGLYGGLLRYHGDYADWATNEAYGVSAEAYVNPCLGFQLNLASGTLSSQNAFRATLTSVGANLIVRALPYYRLTPLVYGGVGLVSRSGSNPFNWLGRTYFQYQLGGGLQYSFNNIIGLRALLDYNLPNTDMLDGRRSGTHNDFYVRTTLGLFIHFGSSRTN